MSLLSLTSDELDELVTIYQRIDALLKEAKINGFSTVGGQVDPSSTRSSVLAWRARLRQAMEAGDLDIFRVYDRFIESPDIEHDDITPAVLALRRAGINPTAPAIAAEHIKWHGEAQRLIPKRWRGGLGWSDTAMESVVTVYVAGSDSMRRIVAGNIHAVLSMIKERNIKTYDELSRLLNDSDGVLFL